MLYRTVKVGLLAWGLGLVAYTQIFGGTASPRRAQEEAGKAYREGYNLILDENWTAAMEILQNLIKQFPKSDWADDAQFWLCYATEKTDTSLEEAFRCYHEFAQNQPKSEWANDTKMNLVRIAHELASQGKPQYEEMVQSFRSAYSSDNEVALTVLMALLDIGDEGSISAVLSQIDRTSDEEVRSKVVRMLGDHSKIPAVLAKLSTTAREDASPRVRRSAVNALGEMKNAEAVGILQEIALSDDTVGIRKAALSRLGHVRGKEKEMVPFLKNVALTESDATLMKAAVGGLRDTRGAEALEALQSLYRESESKSVRRAVVRAIGDRRRDRQATLQFLLAVARNDSEETIRRSAVYSIGRLRTTEALDNLKEIAGSNLDLKTREAAVGAIRDFRGELAVRTLLALVKSEKDARLRKTMARILGRLKKDSAIAVLVELAQKDSNSDVKKAAVRALGNIRSPAARQALLELLRPKPQ